MEFPSFEDWLKTSSVQAETKSQLLDAFYLWRSELIAFHESNKVASCIGRLSEIGDAAKSTCSRSN